MTSLLDGQSRIRSPSLQQPQALVGSVLVIGPGPNGRGGIATVIGMHQQTATWQHRRTRWLHTYDDRSALHKISSAISAYLAAPYLIYQADLVHLHLAAQTSLLRELPFIAIARLFRKPLVVHFHAPSADVLFRDTPHWARHFVFRHATRIVALSASWADTFASFEPHASISVLPNPIQTNVAALRSLSGPPIILFVGKLDSRKGYRDLLQAAVKVLGEFPQAQFWFAGHGEVEAASHLATELGIAHSVRLLGWLDRQALEQVYRQVTICTLPSYAEGVPMSVLEAMSYGIPVVCTSVGGLPELIQHGRNGLMVKPGDTVDLAKQITLLLRDPSLAQTIGSIGRLDVQQQYALQNISSALDSLYAVLLKEHPL